MNEKMEVSSDLELQPSFMTLLSPEILLAHLDTDNHDWLAYDSDWFYKVEKKDITLPFQRILHITNNMKNIEIYSDKYEHPKALESQRSSINNEQLQEAEKIIRLILNLEQSTAIENWTQDTKNRTLVEDIIASQHIKILSLV